MHRRATVAALPRLAGVAARRGAAARHHPAVSALAAAARLLAPSARPLATAAEPDCLCQQPAAERVVTSAASPNMGRTFLQCSLKGGPPDFAGGCNFFEWQRGTEPDGFPACGCGQPAAARKVKKQTENYGRWFFSCDKQQQDATRCNFFEWHEPPADAAAVEGAEGFGQPQQQQQQPGQPQQPGQQGGARPPQEPFPFY